MQSKDMAIYTVLAVARDFVITYIITLHYCGRYYYYGREFSPL